MARYYKGAGVGTYWHTRDARLSGFTPAAGGMPAGASTIKSHIVNQLVDRSPYISLTRSWEVAECFARFNTRTVTLTPANPGYIYILEIPDSGVADLIDPIQEIHKALGAPFAYHHDGGQDIILGLADSANFAHVLTRPIKMQGIPTGQGPSISGDLYAMVRALRDAEVLVRGAVPSSCVIDRHNVF